MKEEEEGQRRRRRKKDEGGGRRKKREKVVNMHSQTNKKQQEKKNPEHQDIPKRVQNPHPLFLEAPVGDRWAEAEEGAERRAVRSAGAGSLLAGLGAFLLRKKWPRVPVAAVAMARSRGRIPGIRKPGREIYVLNPALPLAPNGIWQGQPGAPGGGG